jgi:hypothetical protein
VILQEIGSALFLCQMHVHRDFTGKAQVHGACPAGRYTSLTRAETIYDKRELVQNRKGKPLNPILAVIGQMVYLPSGFFPDIVFFHDYDTFRSQQNVCPQQD